MDIQENSKQTQEKLPPKPTREKKFFKIGLLLLILGGFGYFFFWSKAKISPQPSSYQELNSIVKRFADAKKEEEEGVFIYSFQGNLVRMWFEEDLVVYEYDLGKGVLVGQTEKISLPIKVLPFNYFGKTVASKEELDLGRDDLNLPSVLKIWCQGGNKENQPCQLVKWSMEKVSSPEEKKEIDYQEVIKKALAWLEKQRNEKGIYYSSFRCFVDGTCEAPVLTHTAGLSVLWGRFQYVIATQDEAELTKLKRDIKVYADENLVPLIQNDFWNCKLMYELFQSELFSEEEKGQIEKICSRAGYYPLDLKDINDQIQKGEVEQIDLGQIVAQKPSIMGYPKEWSRNGKKLTEYSTYASDFVTKYLWQSNEMDLRRARAYFGKSVELWRKEPAENYLGGKCTLGTASLDLYQASPEKSLLDFATSFFEKESIGGQCLVKKGEMVRNWCANSIMELATCGLFARELGQVTGDQKYQDFALKVKEYVVQNLFDSPGYGGHFIGDNAFNSIVQWSQEKEASVPKSIRGNGLMVGFLSK